MTNKEFGKRLKYARKLKGLTAAEVAEAIHVASGNYVYIYERGKTIPPPETIINLCKLYGTTPNFLFGMELDLKENLIEKISLLPPIEIEFLSVIIDEQIKKSDRMIKVLADNN